MHRRVLPALLAALICAALSWAVREAAAQRFAGAPGTAHAGSWFSAEPDGLYHLRRVERTFQEGWPVAARDAHLNAPHGAAIPWPPYYDTVLALLSSAGAPSEEAARRAYLERFLATLPMLFGILTSALAALLAYFLTRRHRFAAALAAGAGHAASFAAAQYAAPGSADHHAWVSLVTLSLFGVLSLGLRHGAMWRARPARITGILGGALAGVLIGSWVAGLVALVLIQLVFGWLLLWQRKTPRPALAQLGVTFHLTAAVVLLPAVWASPWRLEHPWMVVNLSWFHLLELGLGALVFVPLRRDPSGGRWHPLLLPGLILALGGGLVAAGIGPGAGIRASFEWVSRADSFMSGIAESEPLWGGDTTGSGGALRWLGYGLLLAPLAWAWIVVQAFWKGRSQHLIWAIALPVVVMQALGQRRFAEAAAAPLALVIALFLAESVLPRLLAKLRLAPAEAKQARSQSASGNGSSTPRTLGSVFAAVLALVIGAGLHGGQALGGLAAWGDRPNSRADNYQAGLRQCVEWLQHQPQHAPLVLAPWDMGHLLEWGAGARTLATNFGSYVGEQSFLAPARFFLHPLTPDGGAAQAEAMLAAHQVDYVLRPARLTMSIDDMVRRVLPQGDNPFVEKRPAAKGGRSISRLTPAWFATAGAALALPHPSDAGSGVGAYAFEGGVYPLPFLRLVFLSPLADADPRHGIDPQPSAMVWQRVAGARLSRDARSGDSLEVVVPVQLTWEGREVFRFEYGNTVVAAADGPLLVRVPYATGSQGAATARPASWRHLRAGEVLASAQIMIAEAAVIAGEVISLNPTQ